MSHSKACLITTWIPLGVCLSSCHEVAFTHALLTWQAPTVPPTKAPTNAPTKAPTNPYSPNGGCTTCSDPSTFVSDTDLWGSDLPSSDFSGSGISQAGTILTPSR